MRDKKATIFPLNLNKIKVKVAAVYQFFSAVSQICISNQVKAKLKNNSVQNLKARCRVLYFKKNCYIEIF